MLSPAAQDTLLTILGGAAIVFVVLALARDRWGPHS